MEHNVEEGLLAIVKGNHVNICDRLDAVAFEQILVLNRLHVPRRLGPGGVQVGLRVEFCLISLLVIQV